jgi:hypothetical protein
LAWGWPNHPQATLAYIYFIKNKKKCDGSILEKKCQNGQIAQFESLGGLSVTFETFEVKVQIDG